MARRAQLEHPSTSAASATAAIELKPQIKLERASALEGWPTRSPSLTFHD